jgi:hypothetical protein
MKFRKLIEGVEIDSLGNQLTPEQSKYFANSKVRDTQGRLLVCYHGTNTKFSSFEHVKKGMQLGADLGFWFTTNVNVARRFSQVSGDDDIEEFLKWRDAKEEQFINDLAAVLSPYLKGLSEKERKDAPRAVMFKFDQWIKDRYHLNDVTDSDVVKINNIRDDYFAFWHTDTSNLRAEFEKTYAPKSIPTLISAYLNIEKLKILNGGDIGVGWTRFNEIGAAEDEGYDGVLIKSGDTGHGIAAEYVVFNSNQIKLITNKIPTSSKNINEKSESVSCETDNLGNELSTEQSRYFKNSKVRDRNGNLLVVHHGTYNSFDSFDAGDIGFHFGTERAAKERRDYYDDVMDREWKVGKYYLNITNFLDMYDIADWDGSNLASHIIESRLLDLSDDEIRYLQQIQMMGGLGMDRGHKPTAMLRKFLTDRGIDGIMYENAYEDSGSISYIAFNPEQIKSISNKTPTSSKNLNEDTVSIPSLGTVENLFTEIGYPDNSINHSAFIFPDGKIFYNNTHEDFYIELCDRGLIDDYYDDFLVTKYDCIRCCDIDDYENYVELPKAVTMKQLHTLGDWLNKAENRYCYDHLQICSRRESFIEKVYDLNALRREGEDVVRYIMNRIKRFVSSGVLLEGNLIAEPNVYVDFVNELHSTFNSMSTEQVISFLNINQRSDLDTESPMFILPNGKFVSVQETLDANGMDVEELTHQSICECFAWCLMSDLKYDTDTVAEIVDQDWRLEREFANLLSELTYKLGWARINCGTKAVDNRFYGVIPNEVTNKQWWSLEHWLEWGYDHNKSDVLIFVTDSAIAKKFKMNDFAPVFPEDIIKNIRRFYSSGRFYESVSDKKLTESLQRLASNAFITDSPYQVRDLLMNKPKLYRILYDRNIDMYMIGDGMDYIHWDLIEAAYEQGYYYKMDNFIDEIGTLDNYVEFGQGGQFLDDQEIESYLIYMVFAPDDDWFSLGEDGYQFKYPLSFGTIYTRDSYLEDCDLYKVVKATNNIGVNEKMDNKLLEGVWSLPDTQGKVDTIKNLFANPISLEDVQGVKDTLYDILGSDDLFDSLDNGENIDYRDSIAAYIEYFLDNYPGKIDQELEKQLNSIISSYDSTYGSNRFINEGIIHTDEDDNVNGLKLASALKVGDVFYDDRTQHKMKVIAVREESSWATMVAVEDLKTGVNEERRLGNLALVELAGDNDIEVEVDDDIDIEWHPIDDYFDGDI